jgi:hypothetical protein
MRAIVSRSGPRGIADGLPLFRTREHASRRFQSRRWHRHDTTEQGWQAASQHYAHLAPSYVADTIRAHFPNLGIARENNVRTMQQS